MPTCQAGGEDRVPALRKGPTFTGDEQVVALFLCYTQKQPQNYRQSLGVIFKTKNL